MAEERSSGNDSKQGKMLTLQLRKGTHHTAPTSSLQCCSLAPWAELTLGVSRPCLAALTWSQRHGGHMQMIFLTRYGTARKNCAVPGTLCRVQEGISRRTGTSGLEKPLGKNPNWNHGTDGNFGFFNPFRSKRHLRTDFTFNRNRKKN